MGYAKEQPTIETKIIFVISGGAKREKDYFKLLVRDGQIKRLKIAFVSKTGQGLLPKQMNTLAQDFLEKKRFQTETASYSINADDRLFLLQDMDEFEADIRGIFVDGQTEQTTWIISNPSFEIWLFYHKFDSTEGLLDEGRNKPVSERSQWLKHRLNELVPGGINPVNAFADIRTAIANSRKNYAEEGGMPQLYATQMYILAESVLNVLDNEFDEMLKRRENRTKMFLKGE